MPRSRTGVAYAHRGDGAGVPCVTERAWQHTVLDAAGYLGWLCIHQFDARRSTPGFPDAVCVRDGAMVALEFKTAKGRVRPEQEVWLSQLDAVPGITARVARPDDWEAVLELLSRREPS